MVKKGVLIKTMKQKKKALVLWLALIAVLLAASLLTAPAGTGESVQEVMRDAVLHETGQVSLFGLTEVNPGLISAYVVTALLLVLAVCLRVFAVPRFRQVPGRLQLLLELWVGTFSSMAEKNSPHKNKMLGAYLFGAGSYIFVSTLFEMLGLQAVTVAGHSIALPAPLSDVNGAIAMGVLSYLFILTGGVTSVGLRGALLSGLLVTELVYYYIALSFVLPVIVGVLFTLLHALIQSYVLTMLVALYYGEVSEPLEPKHPKPAKHAGTQDNKALAA